MVSFKAPSGWERSALDTYKSEVGAFANQRLLGNKSFVKKLITTEPSAAEKLIGKLREIRENLSARKDPKTKAQLDFTRKAERLFMQALSEAGGTIDATGKIHIANREEGKEKSPAESGVKRLKGVDNDASEGYNNSDYMARRGRARGVLSQEDRALLDRKSPEAKKSGFKAHPRLSDGSYLFEVNNKIVLVSGDFENPVYDGVVDINADNANTAYTIRKDIENATGIAKGQSGTQFIQIVENLYRKNVLVVYRRTDFVNSRTITQQRYPTRPDGYKDFGYSGEQHYGSGGPQKAGRAVTTDSRLVPPSTVPVRHEYVDITGNKRYVMAREGGQYSVYGTGSPRPYDAHPSMSRALKSLPRSYGIASTQRSCRKQALI